LLGVLYIAHPPAGGSRRRALADVAVVAGMILLVWLWLFGHFRLNGHFSDFLGAVFRFNQDYAGNMARNLTLQFQSIARALGPIHRTAPILLVLSVIGLAVDGNRSSRRWSLWLAYVVAIDLAIHSTGRYNVHYFQLWMPVFVIGAAWGLASLPQTGSWMERHGAKIFAACAIASLIAVQVPYYFKSPKEWCVAKYEGQGEIFAASAAVAHEIDQLLEPGETFYVWGAETGLYYESSRDIPTGVFYNYPLLRGPLTASLTRRTLADLSRSRPALVVTLREPLDPYPHDHPVELWWREHYHTWPSNHRGPFDLYVRNDLDLEARLARHPPTQR
jgi:hypothetical protein